MNDKITITLTPVQAKVLWAVVYGAGDAGACKGGNTPQEAQALTEIDAKLVKHHAKWRHVALEPEASDV
jgi:uncharacterized protein with LGFP repeats